MKAWPIIKRSGLGLVSVKALVSADPVLNAPAPTPSAPVPVISGDAKWLTLPLRFTYPDQVWIKVFGGVALSIESYLQAMVRSALSDPYGFLSGAKRFQGEDTPAQLIAGYIDTARQRAALLPSTGAGYSDADLVALGTKYGQQVLDLLKQIPASGYNPALTGSVFDHWGS